MASRHAVEQTLRAYRHLKTKGTCVRLSTRVSLFYHFQSETPDVNLHFPTRKQVMRKRLVRYSSSDFTVRFSLAAWDARPGREMCF